jgi:hypothetical protein
MVGLGIVGLAGTGVAYVLEQMPAEPEEPEPVVVSQEPPEAAQQSPEAASDDGTPAEESAAPPKQKPAEADSCRALVNIRVGGTHDDLYEYRVVDVRFDEDGRVEATTGPGLAVNTADGAYALQLSVQQPRSLPLQAVQSRVKYQGEWSERALWTYPDLRDGLERNADYTIWPYYQNSSRIRATIDEYVAVHNEVVDTEGNFGEESGAVLDIKSGESTQPLRLNMSQIQGRAAAFPHQKIATADGSQFIWDRFEDKGGGDFLLRLANGPGKTLQPEVGVCCYEERGASQMIFARLDRGAFALMAPGYLTRPDGFVRAGDGCGEFGWDGASIYARKRGSETWMPLALRSPDESVQEFLGVYWIDEDSSFDPSAQPPMPTWPTTEALAERADLLLEQGRSALEGGKAATAMENLRAGMRLKMMVGQTPDEQTRVRYAEAVALVLDQEKSARYFEYRLRASDSTAEKRRIRELIAKHLIPVEESATP